MNICEYCGSETDTAPLTEMPANVITDFIGAFCSNCKAGEFHPIFNDPRLKAQFPDKVFLPDTILYVRPWDH